MITLHETWVCMPAGRRELAGILPGTPLSRFHWRKFYYHTGPGIGGWRGGPGRQGAVIMWRFFLEPVERDPAQVA